MKLIYKLLSICVFAAASTYSFSIEKDTAVQFTYGKVYSLGTIDFQNNSNLETVTENFILEGQSVNLKYIYSPFSAISLSYHMLESCKIDEANTRLGCHISSPIEGGSVEFLTGLNMAGKGIFLFTGVGYYLEKQQNTEFQELYIPVGLGVNLNKMVFEVSYAFRNAPHYDAYEYSIFSATDPDYTIQSTHDIFAPSQPITLSVGMRF